MKTLLALAALAALAVRVPAQVPEWVTLIIAASELPVVAAQARTEGIAADQVRAAIEAMERARVRASDARDILDSARAAHREHGPIDNFGAFVQARLDAGLRGRELAAAIRAEHATRGRGAGTQRGRGGPGDGQARDTAAGRGVKGPPAERAQKGQSKRPDRPNR